jgi:hypothetical protein
VRQDTTRTLIAFAGHAPALWLFYRETIPRGLWAANGVAVGLTLLAMLAAGLTADRDGTVAAVGVTWLICHVIWGAFLARRLPPAAAAAPPRSPEP